MAVILEVGEVVRSRRLQFSRLTAADSDAMSKWLSPELAPDWRFEDFSSQIDANNAVLISENESGDRLGVATVSLDEPLDGSASLTFISIDPQHRFRGLGGEAGLSLENHIRRRLGIDRVFVPVPDGRGLAVYFWLRLGFHPVLKSTAPWPLAGLSADPRPGIWLLRDEE